MHCFFSRGVLNSLPVCVLNIRHVVLQAEGPSTLRQSQPSVEGDRTVRWPPQGREQFLLLMHPRRQDWSAPYPPLPPSPLIQPPSPFPPSSRRNKHPLPGSHLHLSSLRSNSYLPLPSPTRAHARKRSLRRKHTCRRARRVISLRGH